MPDTALRVTYCETCCKDTLVGVCSHYFRERFFYKVGLIAPSRACVT
jgi:hypothetical protein